MENTEGDVSDLELHGQDKIWDYFQNEAPEAFLGSVPRIKHLLSKAGPGQRLLNIGVGSGLLEKMALEKQIDVFSLDPVPRSIEQLRNECKLGQKAQVGYSEDMPFADAQFDLVVMSEVLEHLTDESIRQSLKEIVRVLKPAGLLIGTVPARENLMDQMVVCPDCHKRFHRWGHQQQFDVARVRTMLSEDFTPLDVHERAYIPVNILNWKGKAVALVKLGLSRMGVHGSGENVFFEVRKRA